MSGKERVATAYLVLRAKRTRYGRPNTETGLMDVESVSVTALRKARPAKLAVDEIAVKVRIQVPADAFAPLAPEALIVVPADLTQRGPIAVDAVDANGDDEMGG